MKERFRQAMSRWEAEEYGGFSSIDFVEIEMVVTKERKQNL
jgi:hypothetical protein